MTGSITEVRRFWARNPCDSGTSKKPLGSAAFFDEIAALRYNKEWHIPAVAGFADYAGKNVLEVGCGIGADACQFAMHGAKYTGLDLTIESARLTKQHLNVKGFGGHTVQGDAEAMPFDDCVFDHIYSFGVIHHSPSTEAIVREMYRVLRPGGTVCVMVYHKHSVNYWIEIMVLRKLLRYVLLPALAPRLLAALTGYNREKLERQRIMFFSALARKNASWLSMNTDGPDCPLAKVYTRASARRLFSMFGEVTTRVRFVDKSHYPVFGKAIPKTVQSFVGRLLGWHLIIEGRKQDTCVSYQA